MRRACTIVGCGLRRMLAAFAVLAGVALGAKVPVSVDGIGWWRDREMRRSLERLMNTAEVDTLDANAIEDGAVILNSALSEEGFQQPEINIAATLTDGSVRRFRFDPTFTEPIPRPLAATKVAFDVRTGVRWRVSEVTINGLTQFPLKEGEAYFRSDATLLNVARTNAFSNSQLNRSENALLDELRRRGYAEATVEAAVESVDRRTGEVKVRVDVREGARWVIRNVQMNDTDAEDVSPPDLTQWEHSSWTPTLEQDIRQSVRVAFYAGGYPDVGVHVAVEPDEPQKGRRATDVTITVVPGARVRVGRVRFEGNEITRDSVLRRRVEAQSGDPLNPIELERARHRISRLGVFQSVDLKHEPPDAPIRDPVFVLREGLRYETNLLAGYGTYEQLRGGVEYRQMNIFGLAHQSRLLLVQSMKSSRADYTYMVPELFGETIDGSAKLFGLQRQEIAFVREEYGATFSVRRALPGIQGEAMAGYTFEALRNRRNVLSTESTDERQLNVASLTIAVSTDRRDNPLRPRRGYHATLQSELASPLLGGVAQYQRVEVGGAYHTPWGLGRWIHVGVSHGLITTMGAPDDGNLPVNKRFYPGGENSIRGYRVGEAAPRGGDGRFVGAKSYALVNVELEQALTQSWSVVAFVDGLGTARALRDYPFDERLYSAGLGLRYQTILGPIRAEYGRNLNPRSQDPGGMWQFSIGYPF